MKSLLLGILAIILIGIGGLVYRNAVEHPLQPIACPLEALTCPDGTSVSRTGSTCTFQTCPPPNVTLQDLGISFALPTGFSAITYPDTTSAAAYGMPANASSTNDAVLVIRQYAIEASSDSTSSPQATALATIQKTAVGHPSGLPVSATSFTSTVLDNHRFTVVSIERFEGVVDTAYYFARATDILRFDAIDMNVVDWTDANLDIAILPAHAALVKLLTTFQDQ